jgi:hypothetical protein
LKISPEPFFSSLTVTFLAKGLTAVAVGGLLVVKEGWLTFYSGASLI